MLFNQALKKIEEGLKGGNVGLSHGFSRLVDYVPDIQQGTYYIVGGESGTGKTAFADAAFVFNPFEDYYAKKKVNSRLKLKVIYFSLEIDATIKITKAICRRLWLKYGILTDTNYVLSRGKNRISDEIYQKVKECAFYFEELEDCLQVIDEAINPTGISIFLHNYFAANGTIETKDFKTTYTPNNPDLYTIAIIDHVGLAKKEQGLDDKSNIDRLSQFLVPLRNIYGLSPVILQQFNRTISGTERAKLDQMRPKLSDYKGTNCTIEDCNIAFALFNPSRHEMESFMGYNIASLQKRFIACCLLKNRDGESDVDVGLKFIGEVGHFEELPRPEQMKPSDYAAIQALKKYNVQPSANQQLIY